MRQRQDAHVLRWRQDSSRPLEWWVVWHDFSKEPPAKRRVNCRTHGATTREARRALVTQYLAVEAATRLDAVDQIEHGRSAFDTPLAEALQQYKCDLDARRAARDSAPGARVGIAEASAREAWHSVSLWRDYLVSCRLYGITTGTLQREHLAGWVRWLATHHGQRGSRGPATIGKHSRHVKAALRWMDSLRPRLLRDLPHLVRGLKPPRQPVPTPEAIEPAALRAFLRAALERDAVGTATVKRKKGKTGKEEEYVQRVPASDTSVARLFLLLAALGCRLGEALALKWTDIDLDRGLVHIHDEKRGCVRHVPLRDQYQGLVAPELVDVLRAWRVAAGDRPWVLPSRSGSDPTHSRQGWRTLEATLGVKCNPQRLRRSWVSFACACGLSPVFAAMLAGHTTGVAERWYRGVVLDRAPGKSMLAAMGLATMLEGDAGDTLRRVV